MLSISTYAGYCRDIKSYCSRIMNILGRMIVKSFCSSEKIFPIIFSKIAGKFFLSVQLLVFNLMDLYCKLFLFCFQSMFRTSAVASIILSFLFWYDTISVSYIERMSNICMTETAWLHYRNKAPMNFPGPVKQERVLPSKFPSYDLVHAFLNKLHLVMGFLLIIETISMLI